MQAALKYLEEYAKGHEGQDIVNIVIMDYKRIINQLRRSNARHNAKLQEQKEELRIKVMDTERSEIHGMYEAGEISREQAKELRRYTNYIESVILHKHVE
jgi:CPA1 family monovalent cation:H+ antiporter